MRAGEPGGAVRARGVEGVGGAGEVPLRSVEGLLRLADEPLPIAGRVDELRSPPTVVEDVLDARAPAAQEPLDLGHARLQAVQGLGVEVDGVLVAAQVARDVLDVDERALEPVGKAGEPRVVRCRPSQQGDG